MISRDPNRTPTLDPEAAAEAAESGLKPLHVICFEPGADPAGDEGGVSFITLSEFLPRARG
jgi:hypothetical protein